MLKKAHISYILACHLQIDADPDPDPAYHFDADPDFYLMRIRMRIQVTKLMRIHAEGPDPDPQHCLHVRLDRICFLYCTLRYFVEFIFTARYVGKET